MGELIDPVDFVLVARAPTSFLAQLWVGRLRASGLEVIAGRDHLMDEFTLSQSLMGAGTVPIYVHRDQEAVARRILEAMNVEVAGSPAPGPAEAPDESSESPEPAEGSED